MPAIIKITEPDEDWEGWNFSCHNYEYHSLLFDEDDDCPTCEKIMNKYYVKYIETLLENENLSEKGACFVVGPKDRKNYFDGWVVWFFENDLTEGGVSPEIDWNMCREDPSKPPKILRSKSNKTISCISCGVDKCHLR